MAKMSSWMLLFQLSLLLIKVSLTFGVHYINQGSIKQQHEQRHRLLYKKDADNAGIAPSGSIAQKPNGDESCPCVSLKDLQATKGNLLINNISSILGPNINTTDYGYGCAPHDKLSSVCSDDSCSYVVPLPADCDKFWCDRSWCYVNASNCRALHKQSVYFADRHFSYATCGHIDSFTLAERRNSVEGKTYRVAFNANTGGWKGSYNTHGNFAINDQWYGPIVDFVKAAALVGKFTINITRPPEWLYQESQWFYGSNIFDYCVYATSLGYIDFCVGAYTITSKRAAFATFFETTDNGLYLITFTESGGTSWDVFTKELLTVFQPFTWGVWLLIMFFVIPTLSVLMLLHEHGAPGSAYPRKVPVLVEDNEVDGQGKVRERRVPIIKHLITAVYMGILSFFQESYSQAVVTVGGKIHLLAFSVFVLMVVAVYTANLAAILTQDIQRTSITSLAGAIKAGHHICAERKVSKIITRLYNIDPGVFVIDPVDRGGDGLPGFNCPECAARTRVFDFMKQDKTDSNLYCEVAIASLEDLEVMQSYGEHCNKTRVGDVLAHQSNGIPIYSEVSQELISLFHEMENDGFMKRAVNDAYPESACPERQGEGTALTVQQMTGIWITTFTFALIALVTRVCRKKFQAHQRPVKERLIQRYDQWKQPTGHSIIINGQKFDPGNIECDESADQDTPHSHRSVLSEGVLNTATEKDTEENPSATQEERKRQSDDFSDECTGWER